MTLHPHPTIELRAFTLACCEQRAEIMHLQLKALEAAEWRTLASLREQDNFLQALFADMQAFKAGFNPNQPRVPAGNPNGGEWTRITDAGEHPINTQTVWQPTPINEIYDPPIEPVYPELALYPILRIGHGALSAALRVLQQITTPAAPSKRITQHGITRGTQRNITLKEAQAAIASAKKTGNVVTKSGKYGTAQHHYKGKNGITVVVESEGRNAGKIITFWRH